MKSCFDIKLIPEFVVEWIEKAQMVCDLCGVKQVEWVLTLQFTGVAFALYLQLSQEDKMDATRNKKALCTDFVTDAFTAYEQFASRSLWPGKTVDIYLAKLRKLKTFFKGWPDRRLLCAFVTFRTCETSLVSIIQNGWSSFGTVTGPSMGNNERWGDHKLTSFGSCRSKDVFNCVSRA